MALIAHWLHTAPSHSSSSTKMCFVHTDSRQMLCVDTLTTNNTPHMTSTTFPTHLSSFLPQAFGCHTTRSGFSSFCFNSQQGPYKSDTQTAQRLSSPSRAEKNVFAPVQTENAPVSSSERQLGSLIESYGFAWLRYAAAGGMRSFRQPPLLSPPLSLPLRVLRSLARRLGGESKRYRGNSAHL